MTTLTEGLLPVSRDVEVSTLLLGPPRPDLLFVLAHGAGAGMRHPFLEGLARGLLERDVATLRYQFPYMEAGRRWPPDPDPVLVATVRAAVARAGALAPEATLVAGGKSLGGRMTSTAAAAGGLPGVSGIALVGFPLHPSGKPATEKGAHLARVGLPMLLLQGTRDRMADLDLLRGVLAGVEPTPELHPVEGADHGFQVLVRSGRTEEEVVAELCDRLARWGRGLGRS